MFSHITILLRYSYFEFTFPAGSSTLPLSKVLMIEGFVNNNCVSASLWTFLFVSSSSATASSFSTSEPPSSSSTAPSSVSSPSASSSWALTKRLLRPWPENRNFCYLVSRISDKNHDCIRLSLYGYSYNSYLNQGSESSMAIPIRWLKEYGLIVEPFYELWQYHQLG